MNVLARVRAAVGVWDDWDDDDEGDEPPEPELVPAIPPKGPKPLDTGDAKEPPKEGEPE